MSVIDLASSQLLGRRAAQAVHDIADPEVRDQVSRAILVCDDALEVVDALDLSTHELSLDDVASLAMWNSLAPDARNILIAMRGASERLLELFPAPPEQELQDTTSVDLDLDQAFDDMAQGRLPDPIRDRRDQDIDKIVAGVQTSHTLEEVGRAIAALAGMLQSDFVNFGQRLQSPAVVGDRWFLLSELQEMRQKCSQCLEAVVATVLKAFAREDLETVLPRYQDSVRRAQRLRFAVTDLSLDVGLLNEQAHSGSLGDLRAIRHALILRLNEFAEQGCYLHVRPLDKQQIITFRRLLAASEPGPESVTTFRHAVEGFSKFLEVLWAINDREVLTVSDRNHLQTIRMLLESEEEISAVQRELEAVYGRDRALDAMIRQVRDGLPVDPEQLLGVVGRVYDSVRASGAAW